jgi:hypothetical protein
LQSLTMQTGQRQEIISQQGQALRLRYDIGAQAASLVQLAQSAL